MNDVAVSAGDIGSTPRSSLSKVLGGALIVAGTGIGAGMFSLPVVSSGMWFSVSIAVLVLAWFCCYSSALYLLEVNLHYKDGASFDTLAGKTIGNTGRLINGASVAFVCYILTYAYISGGSSIISHSMESLAGIAVESHLASLIFAVGLSVFVIIGPKAVDRITTVMVAGMVITFLSFTGGLVGSAQQETLFPALPVSESLPFVLMALPFMMVSFGFHNCVPSLVKYMGGKESRPLRNAILAGSLLALVIYILWQVSIMGNLSREAFGGVLGSGGNIGALIRALEDTGISVHLSGALQVFSQLAVATSFVGVSLGLFDYLADLFGFSDDMPGRLKTAALTFIPPTLLGVFIPDGFITAIGFAGLGATFFCVIGPVLMVRQTRRQGLSGSSFRVSGGNARLWLVLTFGVAVMLLEVLNMLKVLPAFTG
ncbi:tryptophan permease [Kistimonas scapharcae]|uniref:Aromatic amino acid permease n=1 Tax=Kistimonas scapharcae TaxID=1036133 RepID=A0ABP8UVU9_9GAMM